MTQQTRDALQIARRYECAILAEMRKKFGETMEPEVKAIYDERAAVAANLKSQLEK